MKLTANKVYDKLLNDDQILTQKGRISFRLADIDTRADGASWKHAMTEAYAQHYGKRLSIPRWSDISGKYFKK